MATTTQTTTQQFQPFIEDFLKNILTTGQTVAGEPYQPYGENRIAGFTGPQQTAFNTINNNVNSWQPTQSTAINQAGQRSSTLSPEGIKRFMNPYTQNVTDRTTGEMKRQFDILQKDNKLNAAGYNALGNSRYGIVESEGQRNFMDQISNTVAGLNERNYTQAVDTATNQQKIGLQGAELLGNLNNQRQNMLGTDIERLLSIGGMQQMQTQRNLSTAYDDFQDQRDLPMARLEWLNNLVRGNPLNTPTTSTRTSGGNNFLGQVLGILGAGAGLIGGSDGFQFSDIFDVFR